MMIDVALFTTASLLQPAHQGRQTSTFLVVRRGSFRQRATKYVSNPRVFCHATSAPSQRKCTFLYLLEQLVHADGMVSGNAKPQNSQSKLESNTRSRITP